MTNEGASKVSLILVVFNNCPVHSVFSGTPALLAKSQLGTSVFEMRFSHQLILTSCRPCVVVKRKLHSIIIRNKNMTVISGIQYSEMN